MEDGGTWMSLFFSGTSPDFLKTNEPGSQTFRPFCAEDDNWGLGTKVDISRVPDATCIQVFWLRVKGRRKYIGKVVSGDSHYTRAPINPISVPLLF
jgi:hypothetical protein